MGASLGPRMGGLAGPGWGLAGARWAAGQL